MISNDGSGYVPEGVYVPRDVRLLVADPLVEKEFRDYWFGWQDPARVLVAYARLRATGNEWQLVAAASTGPVDALREAHIECGWADREHSPLASENWQPPGLDGLHVHRLELEHPDLYEGLQRVANAEGPYHDRLMWPLASQLWAAARTSGVDVPLVLRSVWKILEANGQDFLKFSFTGDCIVSVQFSTRNGLTIIELEQTDIPQESDPTKNLLVQCQIGWTFYLANLKSVMEGGKDLRNKRVELTSCFK